MAVTAVLAAVLVVTGCGSTGGGDLGVGPVAAASGSSLPSRSPQAPTPSAATPSAAPSLTGVLVEGVRPTCRMLDTGARRYALVGPGTQSLRVGDRVRVEGTERPGLVSPCGLTFVVTALYVLGQP
jgi:hypothetical protein